MVMDAKAKALCQPPEIDGERVRPDTSAIRLGAYERIRGLADTEPEQLLGLLNLPTAQFLDGILPE